MTPPVNKGREFEIFGLLTGESFCAFQASTIPMIIIIWESVFIRGEILRGRL
jgi:hypothetical protein